jgi:DNA-directed RNA polymerase specialized sigma24 family protein
MNDRSELSLAAALKLLPSASGASSQQRDEAGRVLKRAVKRLMQSATSSIGSEVSIEDLEGRVYLAVLASRTAFRGQTDAEAHSYLRTVFQNALADLLRSSDADRKLREAFAETCSDAPPSSRGRPRSFGGASADVRDRLAATVAFLAELTETVRGSSSVLAVVSMWAALVDGPGPTVCEIAAALAPGLALDRASRKTLEARIRRLARQGRPVLRGAASELSAQGGVPGANGTNGTNGANGANGRNGMTCSANRSAGFEARVPEAANDPNRRG